MTQESRMQVHLADDRVPRSSVIQSSITRERPESTALQKNAMLPILAATYWFDPELRPAPYPVMIRFSGHRIDVKDLHSSKDHFVQDELIEQVIPGSGPISVTARVRGINAGEWSVTAHVQEPQTSTDESRMCKPAHTSEGIQGAVIQLWRRWAPSAAETESVKTCLSPVAHVPGTLPGVWGAMVLLGIVIALGLQSLIIARIHLAVDHLWMISLTAILVGIIGAKGWYIVLYHRIIGWCIQGFITGASLTAALLLVTLHVPVGAFLDVIAPGLLIAMAVGRVGCFLSGCCGGPPTASRWGVWSSDQRVGARRIPTQLMELGLAGMLGIGVLIAVLAHGTRGGALFVGSLAVYTLVRQGILHLRAEKRKRKWSRRVTLALTIPVLIVVAVLLTR